MNPFLINKADSGAAKGVTDGRLAVEPGACTPSQVGSAVRIEGDIYGQEDLLVDGEVNGNVVLPDNKLTIGANANVRASIKAKNVVLIGMVEGNIEASERIELRSVCSMLGDVRSPRIMVENGAYIKGAVEVVREAAGGSDSPTRDLKALASAVSATAAQTGDSDATANAQAQCTKSLAV
jgi:cytoskeletal protein CcmA (bactofilin family)